MVHDIKNNDGGIMNKIKKLKVKAPPSVPRRDYASETPADEEEQWSDDFDSDYENPDEHSDSEMYVMPAEENGDDSYEPPPAEQETRTVHPALPFTRGEYVDNRSSQRQSPPISKTLPSKPSWPSAKARLTSTLPAPASLQRPQVPPKPRDLLEDEVQGSVAEHTVETPAPLGLRPCAQPVTAMADKAKADYVVPVEDNDENYIHPTESSPPKSEKAPTVNRSTKPNNPSKLASPPGTTSGFPNISSVTTYVSWPQSYAKRACLSEPSRKASVTVAISPGSGLGTDPGMCLCRSEQRDLGVQAAVVGRRAIPTAKGREAEVHCKPWYAGACDRKSAEEALHKSNKEAEVHCKPWYAGACDRKSAEEALHKSNKYFGSVAEIVRNHQHNPLVLIDSQNNTKDSTRLKYAVKVS
ncbi:B-cell linker protein [Tupaia chinensis]|uniref:B-cell linker protein n=1 Tax=Tupaia chinensis TaxID=246437 RepID=L9JFD8_TUPCH|nr:B-cell linker protein [Tupaia chinensis]